MRFGWTLKEIAPWFNTLRPRQDGRHFADNIFTCIFFNENCRISIKFSLKYVRKGPIDNNPALVQIMAWRRSGDKPLSEPMMISLPTHICVTRPQWVNEWVLMVVDVVAYMVAINILRLRQKGRHFLGDIFKCIFLNENVWISYIQLDWGLFVMVQLTMIQNWFR